MASNALQEFVIKLSAQVDNSGVGQMMQLLDSNRLKALGVTAALTAATTAVYKFVESATKTEIELTALAKKQGKTIEATRASETALKAMGKTLNEVKKDKALESIYNDLVKVNKAMALPDMSDGITMIRNLQGAFWELRSTVTYAIQWINAKILANLEEPINRITSKLHEISQWVQQNMQSITTKVSSFITGFAKGVIGIIEGVEKIVNWVHELPEGIQRIGSAVGVVWALIKSGPIGQILTVVTAIGGLIDDYENFQWNKLHEGEEGFEKVGVAFEGLWEKLDPFLQTGDFGGALNALLESLTQGFTKFAEALSTLDLGEFLGNPQGVMDGFLGKLLTAMDSEETKENMKALGTSFMRVLSSVFTLIFGSTDEGSGEYKKGILAYAGDLVSSIVKSLVAVTSDGTAWSTAGADIGSFINELFRKIGSWLKGANTGQVIGDALGDFFVVASNLASGLLDMIVSGFQQLLTPQNGKTGIGSFVEGLVSVFTGSIDEIYRRITNDVSEEDHLDLTSTFSDLGSKIGTAIGEAIKIGLDFLTQFANDAIEWLTSGEGVQKMYEIGKAILEGILAGVGNLVDSIFLSLMPEEDKEEVLQKRSMMNNEDALFVDEETGERKETVIGKSGKEYTPFEYQQLVNKDVESAQIEFGVRAESPFESYRNALWEAMGFGDLRVNEEGFTYQNTTKTPQELVAEAMGMQYMRGDSSLRFNNEYLYDEGTDFSSLVNTMVQSKDVDSLQAAMESLINYIQTNIYGEYGTGEEKNGRKDLETALGKAQDAYATTTSSILGTSTAISRLGITADETNTKLKELGQLNFGGQTKENAYGGRVGYRQDNMTVGEDGTEYIIPITKPERAYSLIMQMLGEMGSTAVTKIMTGLGIGEEGTLGGSVDALAASLGGLNMNVNYTISAPVSIVVNSSSANAEDVGTAAYNAAERHLLRNMRGVFA